MKIILQQSGGFAGISLPSKILETDDDKIISLATSIMNYSGKQIMPIDGFNYCFSFEDNFKTKEKTFYDPLPEIVQQLIEKMG